MGAKPHDCEDFVRITVCVATKNRTDMLHQLLWSLIRQEYADWDLVIVDDSDKPVEWNSLGVYPRLFNEIARTGHDVRIAPGPRVSRIGAAYQAGFRVSRPENPLFFRVDDDSWLEPDYLLRLATLMADQTVGACGGLFLHPGQDIETLRSDDQRYVHGKIENLSDYVNIQWFRHETSRPIPVEHLTANILFSRDRLEKIGGFEANLYQQHRDETQATWRLWVEGAKLYVDPGAVAWHLRGVSGGARGHGSDVYLNDHRTFMAQRKTMKPGIHIRLGHGIGDTFMAAPMLRMMRRMNPDRDISVCAPQATAVLEGSPDIDELTDQPLGAQRTVRFQESVYAWASANDWKGHLAQAYCRMLNLPELDDLAPRFRCRRKKPLPPQLDSRYVVMAPWSNAKTFDLYTVSGNKNWPLDRWPRIIDWAHTKGLLVVQLRGSFDEPQLEGVDINV
ncbi:MAG: glycosyltransferase [Desulfomonile tiedjei]|uniref:Glycosyltransferase n=1 Tax=Desulfomonile tiedjei TaxID=2358 RepID=A0A9D6Z263_9BACT|nr:glycosyltransferase [Desulfomonile tiedjei]